MLRHKNIEKICCIVLICTLILTCAYVGAAAGGLRQEASAAEYEKRLLDPSFVHTIDIVIDDWDGFLAGCTDEEYVCCSVVIDGEAYRDVGLRAKGNTSLSSVASYGNNRYSFKIEFDRYQSGRTYYGLDKLSLNNLIQDKTYMKDYLAYTLMRRAGAAAPLCSFVQISVNGEAWGLYLAVEAVEDGFLIRNYGSDHGELYKPDSMSFGGGRGNGRDFDMSAFSEQFDWENASEVGQPAGNAPSFGEMPAGNAPSFGEMPAGNAPSFGEMPAGNAPSFGQSAGNAPSFGQPPAQPSGENRKADREAENGAAKNFDGMGSSDVKLQYIDDDPDSYPNIFSSAKTDVTEADRMRLIESLRILSQGGEIEAAVDAEAVIRYLAVHHFMCNADSYTGSMIHNYYLYEEDGRLSMLPWDYNLAFGAFDMGGTADAAAAVNAPVDSPVSSGDISDRPMIAWIFESEEYTAMYHEIYREFISGIRDGGWLDAEIVRVSEMIAPYVKQDKTAFYSYEEFEAAVAALRKFCALRCESAAGQLEGTIPSTAEGQRADPSALIDASDVELSDMGEFGMGGGRAGNNRSGKDRNSRGGETEIPPDAMTLPDEMNLPDGTNPFGFSDRPAQGAEAASVRLDSDGIRLLILCISALCAAIAAAHAVKSGR